LNIAERGWPGKVNLFFSIDFMCFYKKLKTIAMKHLFTIFAILFCTLSYGQADLYVTTDEISQVNDLENLVRAWNTNNNKETILENIEGSAYLDENFTDGDVFLATGDKYSKIPLRYNVYNDQIEFKSNSGIVYNINNPESLRELTIGKSRFIYTDCKSKKKEIKMFTEVIKEGKVSLLKHHRIKLMPSKPAETHRDAQSPRFVNIPSEYLIQMADGKAQLFRNKKELLNILFYKSKEINELISREKLSTTKEDELIRIIDFYNSL